MSLKTYETADYAEWLKGIRRVDPFGRKDVDTSHLPKRPGDTVEHVTDHGRGILIAISEEQVTILWSVPPDENERVKQFSTIAFPVVRRVFGSQIANQLVSTRPMSLPAGLIFYLDYTYGEDAELKKKCTEGPIHKKLFWRTWRCLKKSTLSLRSSLSSYWRHLRTKQLPQEKNNESEHHHLIGKRLPLDHERLVEKWTKNSARPR